jgi:hypothetical protein
MRINPFMAILVTAGLFPSTETDGAPRTPAVPSVLHAPAARVAPGQIQTAQPAP